MDVVTVEVRLQEQGKVVAARALREMRFRQGCVDAALQPLYAHGALWEACPGGGCNYLYVHAQATRLRLPSL